MSYLEGIFIDFNNLKIDSELFASGSYGNCFKVINIKKPDQKLCAKVLDISLNEQEQERLLREVLILKNIQHNAIVKFRGFNLYGFTDIAQPTIITDYMENGSLEEMIEKEKENKAPDIWNATKKQICIIGIVAAMRYLHRKHIMHRDLKPENILLDDDLYPKICDFGLARKYSNSSTITQPIGTFLYMAPEILNNKNYSYPVDVYSFALLVYKICTGKNPYEECLRGGTSKVLKYIIETSKEKGLSINNCDINEKFIEFISKCWAYDPSKRPTFEDIYDRLVDDSSLVINESVDMEEVHKYIDLIQDNSTKIGRVKLSLSAPQIIFDGNSSTSTQDTIIPNNEDERIELLKNVIADFSILDPNNEIALFKRMLNYISADDTIDGYKNFVKIVHFVNTFAAQNNQNAINFLKEAFGDIIGENKKILSRSDLLNSGKIRFNISPTITTISEKTFKSCGILSINLPANIEYIGPKAFLDCNKLTWISLDNKMTKICNGTFQNCKSLAYIELPSQLKIIDQNAFKKCTSLVEITIPPLVTEIKPNAFHGCKNLKKVKMSSNVKYDTKTSFPLRAKIVYE